MVAYRRSLRLWLCVICLKKKKKTLWNSLSSHPHIWNAASVDFLVKKAENPFPLCHCFFQTLRELMERKRDESFIHISFPPLCLLLRAAWEAEKSGVKEGKNVRGNWRRQIIVGNWKSCREDVAVEDEVAHCFSRTPNTTSFHLIASFHLTSFFPPFCSHQLLSILSSLLFRIWFVFK